MEKPLPYSGSNSSEIFFAQVDSQYTEECCITDIAALDLSKYLNLINDIGEKIQAGELKPSDLHAGLVKQIYDDVSEPVKKEYGKKWIDYDYKEPGNLIQKFKKNLWQFSSAKTLAELENINGLTLILIRLPL